MHSKFRKIFFVALLAATATITGCGDDNNDDDGNQANTPLATPTPAPTPGSSATFTWATVRFDQREEVGTPPPPGSCNGFKRFSVRADGRFTANDPCTAGGPTSGRLTANELGALDALMKGISREEANARLRCTPFNDEVGRPDQRLSMTSRTNTRYVLYTQDDDKECVSGNPAELTAIRNSLYELQAKYGETTVAW